MKSYYPSFKPKWRKIRKIEKRKENNKEEKTFLLSNSNAECAICFYHYMNSFQLGKTQPVHKRTTQKWLQFWSWNVSLRCNCLAILSFDSFENFFCFRKRKRKKTVFGKFQFKTFVEHTQVCVSVQKYQFKFVIWGREGRISYFITLLYTVDGIWGLLNYVKRDKNLVQSFYFSAFKNFTTIKRKCKAKL